MVFKENIMQSQIDVASLISFISVCGAIVFGYLAVRRNNLRDTEESVEERATMNATILTRLDNISDSLNEIKKDNKDLRNELGELKDRVLVLENKEKNSGR